MKLNIFALWLLLAAVVRGAQSFDVLGYYFLEESFGQMQAAKDVLTQVSFDQYTIDARGNVRGTIYPATALPYAKSNNLKSLLCVNNYGPNDFNGPRIHAVLISASKRARLIKQLMSLALSRGFDGINIDFEAIPRKDRGRLTTFMRALSVQTRAKNLTLVMSVPALDEDAPMDSWGGAFDYRALGELVDVLQIMTYDEHGPWSQPGPIASFPWVQGCIEYAKSVMPPKKVSMGVAGYGYEWNLSTRKGRSLNQGEIIARIQGKPAPVWDDDAKSPSVSFTEAGQRYVIWFEDAQSLRIKGRFARESGIAGVSFWALDGLSQTYFFDALLG